MPPRKLSLKARAVRMEETRQRIVRAAYSLHCTVGPARTTVSAIAQEAGVQRHTVYQHFPDELSLSAACTTFGLAQDPQPNPDVLAQITDPGQRLRTALTQQYDYYSRNATLLSNVFRDAPLFQQQLQASGVDWQSVPEVIRAFFGQPRALRDALLTGWSVDRDQEDTLSAALALAVDFGTWRVLEIDQGLDRDQAVNLMASLVVGTIQRPGSHVGDSRAKGFNPP